jgi:phage/plasmid primase-like uncharacterized protein
VCDSGSDIRSLQFIDASGCKRFLAGGRVTGCYFVIEDPKNGVPTVSRAMLNSGFHTVWQDDEFRRPAVVIRAKTYDVNLGHTGRKMARKLRGEQEGRLLYDCP